MKNGKLNYYATSNKYLRFFLEKFDLIFKNKKVYRGIEQLNNPRILFVRIEHLGDVISTFSLLNIIKSQSRKSKIDILIANHCDQIKCLLEEYNNVFITSPTIFHDRSEKFIIIKILNTIKAYIKAFLVIVIGNYDCVIFPSHHIFGMQSLGFFAKESLAFSSTGLSRIHSSRVPIKYTDNLNQRSHILASYLFPRLSKKIKFDSQYKNLSEKFFKKNITGKYVLLTMTAGNKEKFLNLNDLKILFNKYKNIKDIEDVYLIGEIHENINLKMISKFFKKEVKYIGEIIQIKELINLIYNSKAIISSDSFLCHLSSLITKEIPIYIIYKKEIGFLQWQPPGENIYPILIN